jgi:hypothetical protein
MHGPGRVWCAWLHLCNRRVRRALCLQHLSLQRCAHLQRIALGILDRLVVVEAADIGGDAIVEAFLA